MLLLYTHSTDEFDDVFKFELASVPTSLFHDNGDPGYPRNKSILMNKMKIEVSSRGVHPDFFLIDGGGLLHKVYWPTGGLVSNLVDGNERYVRKMLVSSHVYIVFDRYKEESIKSGTRSARIGSFQRSHILAVTRDLPPKYICLSSIKKGKSD